MLTYNELVDLVEQINPEEILREVNEVVDEKLATIKKIYQHNIVLVFTNASVKIRITFNIINNSETQLTFADLLNVLKDFTWTNPYTANGSYFIIPSNKTEIVLGISKVSETELAITFFSSSSGNNDNYSISSATITDNVISIN